MPNTTADKIRKALEVKLESWEEMAENLDTMPLTELKSLREILGENLILCNETLNIVEDEIWRLDPSYTIDLKETPEGEALLCLLGDLTDEIGNSEYYYEKVNKAIGQLEKQT